jgi:hypothetical protein
MISVLIPNVLKLIMSLSYSIKHMGVIGHQANNLLPRSLREEKKMFFILYWSPFFKFETFFLFLGKVCENTVTII